jgi:RNA polymerase sigma-70 factor (ECF subfamily)
MKLVRFEQLYEEHAEPLLGFLVYRTGDRVLAEEVLADTFERVLRARSRFDPRRASAKTWVYSIALNRLADLHRRRDAERRALQRSGADLVESTSDADWVDGRADLRAALAGLDEVEREAVALRYGADLSVPEVADLLGIKVSTAEGRIYRGLRKLRLVLAEEPVGPARAGG